MALKISRRLLDELRDRAAREPDREVCGLLLGRADRVEKIVPARNIASDTVQHFELDPAVLFAAIRDERAGGLQRVGHYHSHPRGCATPSATDARAATEDGQIWVIIGQKHIMAWLWSSPDTFALVKIEQTL